MILPLALMASTGCARRTTQSPQHEVRRLDNVPFYSDSTDQCGPSTLASVLTYEGVPTEPGDLKTEIYLPNLQGTLPMDLSPAVRARGLEASVSNGSLDDVKQSIREGHPVLAYLNLGLRQVPLGHFIAVTGFDDQRSGLYAHSGKKKNEFIPYPKFMRVWNKTDRWMMVVKK